MNCGQSLVLLLIMHQICVLIACKNNVVETQMGKVRGVPEMSIEGREFCSFLGIPYVKAPIGDLRFKDPQPMEPWTETREAMFFGPMCPQILRSSRMVVGNEDCLYLNVYTKSADSAAQQPVMIWIHGGDFARGSGDSDIYGPDYFMRKDVVLVTINYRLGVLGFLSLDDEVISGNFGLKDQVMALKWVKENIANFGGDPNKITIFGQDAGASSVHYLTISPMSKGLFDKAIIQSGSVYSPWARTMSNANISQMVYQQFGMGSSDHKEILDFLRKVYYVDLIHVAQEVSNFEGRLFLPSMDAKAENPFLAEDILEAADKGSDVPILLGYNNQESLKSSQNQYGMNYPGFFNDIERSLPRDSLDYIKSRHSMTTEDLIRFYFDEQMNNRYNLGDIWGDISYVEGVQEIARQRVLKGQNPTYLYRYDFNRDFPFAQSSGTFSGIGAVHGDELSNLFRAYGQEKIGIQTIMPGTLSYRLMEQMIEMWYNFAKDGNPTPSMSDSIKSFWHSVKDANSLQYLSLDTDVHMDATTSLQQRYATYKLSSTQP
ncbi:esterase FE4-like [Trichogramma pretiosum]|uniref:esterase FE4-like n=1 Tax=Trichogramma pretiosum TaxID=7493 RepID=UPI0006C97396|nr:esterase FE4-like [Trichogramma pretiosum]